MWKLLPILVLILVPMGSLPAQTPGGGQKPQGTNPPLPPAGAPASVELERKLDALLKRWESDTSRLETMAVKVTCSEKNPVFNRLNVFEGEAKFMKLASGDYAARLELRNKNDPANYRKFICTGRSIYVYRPDSKEIHVYDLPPRQAGQLPDDGALPFLFGMKAQTARERYDLRLSRENEWYTYVDVLPRYARDQADFIYARLTIMNRDHTQAGVPKDMPLQIYWVEPNKVEVTWTLGNVQRNIPGTVARTEFQKPDLPAGWSLKNDTASTNAPGGSANPPRVIRRQGP